jgi:biofilm PGA synthesis lipoprotein PgaB
VLTLDEIDRARRGETVLPERSILITADDAYASDYTRLFPLLLAYRMHALFAVEGEWIEAGVGPGGSKHITWNQAREMQASGLVELISHGYALHTTIGQPAGQHAPASCIGCSTRCTDTSRKTATASASPRTAALEG